MSEWLYLASVWAVPMLLAITLHEAAHGFAAARLGDDTALRLGRVSINPLRHVDLVGTVLLPAALLLFRAPFLFGWAKPVPVDFGRLRNPRQGMVLVAAAGPGANILLAVISALLIHAALRLPGTYQEWVGNNLLNSIHINLILAVFNMLPLPPLDGGRVAVGLLPRALAMPLARLERTGFLILIGALFILPMLGGQLGIDLNILAWIVGEPVKLLAAALFTVTGLY